jgi:two-component system cell cycle sensor histidine kinase/response regulator CckA
MKKPRIMLVEDEKVVAADIEECVKGLGYVVTGSVASGSEALRLAVRTAPDLVLMDIKLKGVLDGVDVGGALREQLHIPVVYLTAHADAEILERAKKTAPAGYVLKPFDDRTLRTAIEIALDRFRRETQLTQWTERLSTAIGSIDEGVIVTQETGCVVVMNRVAETLTGWTQAQASGKPLREIFTLIDAKTGCIRNSPVGRAFREGISIGLGDHSVLLGASGRRIPIQGSATPVWNGDAAAGVCLLFRPVGSRGRDENWGAPEHTVASRLEIVGRVSAAVSQTTLGLLKTDPDRAAALTERLIAFGRREPEPAGIVDLNQLIAGLEDLLRCTLGDMGLSAELGPDAGPVSADPGQIELLLMSMAISARDTASGGEFCIQTAEHITEFNRDSYGEIVVTQTGAGWDPARDMPALDEISRLTSEEIRVVTEGKAVKIYLPKVVKVS